MNIRANCHRIVGDGVISDGLKLETETGPLRLCDPTSGISQDVKFVNRKRRLEKPEVQEVDGDFYIFQANLLRPKGTQQYTRLSRYHDESYRVVKVDGAGLDFTGGSLVPDLNFGQVTRAFRRDSMRWTSPLAYAGKHGSPTQVVLYGLPLDATVVMRDKNSRYMVCEMRDRQLVTRQAEPQDIVRAISAFILRIPLEDRIHRHGLLDWAMSSFRCLGASDQFDQLLTAESPRR